MRPCIVRLSLPLLLFLPRAVLTAQGGTVPPAHTDVPVRSVMLFSSGVGYFEHAGTVRGDGSTELRFKTAQINDILKSLVLQDLDGGRVTTITYPSQDPISKTLRSFQVDITSNPTMASLLNQLRGAKVTIVSQAEKVTGTILGVETHRKAVEKGEPIETPSLNLLTGAMIRSFDLPAIASLSLDDPQLQDELAKALVALSQARDQDKKPVTINFTGDGERHVRIGYVVETPIWKTSYRLMLDDKSGKLQGWAIVENQTDNDWTDVSLSLVSGRPISFIMDLYQPLYAQRPTVVPEMFAGLRPQVYGAGIASGPPVSLNAITVNAAANPLVPHDLVTTKQGLTVATSGFEEASITTGGPSALFGNAQAGTISVRGGRVDQNATYIDGVPSVRSMATAAQLGALFQYAIPNVTLPRQKSAMIPIVTDSVAIDRLSIYNASVLSTNPLNGVRLKNTTGKHLLQGPITVLDKNAYAGDARIDNVPPGQERLLSYGIDLEMTVDNTKNVQTSDGGHGEDHQGRADHRQEARLITGLHRRQQGEPRQGDPDRTPDPPGMEADGDDEAARDDAVAFPFSGKRAGGEGNGADHQGGKRSAGDAHHAPGEHQSTADLHAHRGDSAAGSRRDRQGDPDEAGGDRYRSAGDGSHVADWRHHTGAGTDPREHEDGGRQVAVLRAPVEQAERAGVEHREAAEGAGRPPGPRRRPAESAGGVPRRTHAGLIQFPGILHSDSAAPRWRECR